MSTYEQDHNISTPRAPPARGRTHQTLASVIDSFLSNNVATSPSPGATIDTFTDALRELSSQEGSSLALELISSLEQTDTPSKGIPDQYIDSLDRVAVDSLDADADCPICTNRFTDDEHPLVVRLPCSSKPAHMFDLECIGPWLKVNSTCPLCRFDLLELDKKRKEKLEEELRKINEEIDEEEEDDWDVYG